MIYVGFREPTGDRRLESLMKQVRTIADFLILTFSPVSCTKNRLCPALDQVSQQFATGSYNSVEV